MNDETTTTENAENSRVRCSPLVIKFCQALDRVQRVGDVKPVD